MSALQAQGHDGRGHRVDADGAATQLIPIAATLSGVRRLTPVEAERLQGWPDGWTAPPGLHAPDGRRYAAIGDGVTAPVAEWIGRRLLEHAWLRHQVESCTISAHDGFNALAEATFAIQELAPEEWE